MPEILWKIGKNVTLLPKRRMLTVAFGAFAVTLLMEDRHKCC